MADPAGRAGQTVREVLAAARVRLEQAGIETAALDARVLFEYILAKPHAWFYANSDVVVPQLRELGYRYVCVDIEGFRSGSLNP